MPTREHFHGALLRGFGRRMSTHFSLMSTCEKMILSRVQYRFHPCGDRLCLGRITDAALIGISHPSFDRWDGLHQMQARAGKDKLGLWTSTRTHLNSRWRVLIFRVQLMSLEYNRQVSSMMSFGSRCTLLPSSDENANRKNKKHTQRKKQRAKRTLNHSRCTGTSR